MNTLNHLNLGIQPNITPEIVANVYQKPHTFSAHVVELTNNSSIPPDRIERMTKIRNQLNTLLSDMAIAEEIIRFVEPEQVDEPHREEHERCASFVK